MSTKALFSRFLDADPDRLHFAAHSHHLWPDAAAVGQMQCFEDAARWVDRKWDVVFGEVLPAVTCHIRRILHLSEPASLCIAPNTHELVVRLLSCLPADRPLRVLTTDSEYHSFRRQMQRLEEAQRATVEWLPAEPFESFPQRFCAAALRGGHDLVFLSHVFFNSGYVVPDLSAVVASVPDPATLVVIDGYHGFCAVPTDLSPIEARAFYIAGAYKYAMSGEGVCFVHAPPGYCARPINTGWMAAIGSIAERQDNPLVPYAAGGFRLFGATFDPSGLYRFRAVMDMLAREGLTVPRIHRHVVARQEHFLAGLDPVDHPQLRSANLLPERSSGERGHFLTFRTDQARAVHDALAARNVVTDYRADRFRIGFGIYHEDVDVDALLHHLRAIR